MGQVWAQCCHTADGKNQFAYQKVRQPAGLLEDLKNHQKDNNNVEIFNFLELQNRLLNSEYITHAVIINFTDGRILAADFECDKEGIRDVVRAFKQRPQFIREEGIRLGKTLPTYILESMDGDQYVNGILEIDAFQRRNSSYGSVAINRGCSAYRTLSSVVIVTYEGHADQAKKYVNEVVSQIIDQGC